MRTRLMIIAATVLLALAGCNGPSATTVNISAAGSANMNGGAPVKLKVFYLKSAGNFASSDFFALFNKGSETLGDNLLGTDDIQMVPGRTANKSRSLATEPTAVGVVAAFRDIGAAKFSAVRRISPGQENNLKVIVSGNSVSIR